jgi:hypothetical protein
MKDKDIDRSEVSQTLGGVGRSCPENRERVHILLLCVSEERGQGVFTLFVDDFVGAVGEGEKNKPRSKDKTYI